MGVDDTYLVPDFGLEGSKTRWVSDMTNLALLSRCIFSRPLVGQGGCTYYKYSTISSAAY